MHSTGTRTDSDIRDEAAGRKRVEMAAASAARREAESALLEQQNEEMKSRHANDMNSVASQKKIEALRLNETAEMCQSITAKFTVFQGSCLMKVQTLHNKIIDFDLLLEKLRCHHGTLNARVLAYGAAGHL